MSEILERWRAGVGLPDTLVIDGHTHFHDWPTGANYSSLAEASADCLAAMDANGVDAACVLSGGFMCSGQDYRRGNDQLREFVNSSPDRFIGFAHINPNDKLENITAELERSYQMGFRCLKLLNSYQQDYPGDGPNLMALYRFAADHRMLILNHYWPDEVLGKIAAQFSGVDFISGHAFSGESLKKFPNVYSNIWGVGSLGFLERCLREAGPEKFLLGSDAFMNPVSVGIGLVVYADIPDTHKRMILGENQARLLDKVGALPPGLKRIFS